MKKIEPSEIGKNPDLIASKCLFTFFCVFGFQVKFSLFNLQKRNAKWQHRTFWCVESVTVSFISSIYFVSTRATIARRFLHLKNA